MRACFVLSLLFTLFLAPSTALTGVTSQGELGVSGRAFLPDHNDDSEDWGLTVNSRLRADLKYKPCRARVRIFGRVDSQDSERSFLTLEEAWFQIGNRTMTLRAGFDMVNWTVTEAFHPADIVNSRNLDSDLQNHEKLGEPSIRLRWRYGEGAWVGYFMPTFIKPNFPSPRSRLNFFSQTDGATYQIARVHEKGTIHSDDDAYPWIPQGAIRWNHAFEDLDLSFHVVHHLDRSLGWPALHANTRDPHLLFHPQTQIGGTLQWAFEGLLTKVEWAAKRTWLSEDKKYYLPFGPPAKAYGLLALGFEYSLSHGNGSESTLLMEGQSVVGISRSQARELEIFQGDVLLAYRHAFNDASSREIRLSMLGDVEYFNGLILGAHYQERLWDDFVISVDLQLFYAEKSPEHNEPDFKRSLSGLRDSDYIQVAMTRYF